MTAEMTFVDTNVLPYAQERSAGRKHDIAKELLAHLWGVRTGLLSTQALQGFYVDATRKLPQPMPAARARVVIAR